MSREEVCAPKGHVVRSGGQPNSRAGGAMIVGERLAPPRLCSVRLGEQPNGRPERVRQCGGAVRVGKRFACPPLTMLGGKDKPGGVPRGGI